MVSIESPTTIEVGLDTLGFGLHLHIPTIEAGLDAYGRPHVCDFATGAFCTVDGELPGEAGCLLVPG